MGRAFAGYAFGEPLPASIFGPAFRGFDAGGGEARLVVVAPALAASAGFARELTRAGEQIAAAEGDRLVALRVVGRAGPDLVCVTDPTGDAVRLDQVLDRVGTLPAAVALAIGSAVLDALGELHAVGLLHGGVHPRSVLIDGDGGVMLTDLGLAWALTDAAAEIGDPRLLGGLDGFVAPEVAAGGRASVAADVYGCAALIHRLLAERAPSREAPLVGPARLVIAIERALETDRERRASGRELREGLDEAVARHGQVVGAAADVAALVARLAAPPRRRGLTDALDALAEPGGDALAGPAGEADRAAFAAPPRRRGLTDALDALAEPGGDALAGSAGEDDRGAFAASGGPALDGSPGEDDRGAFAAWAAPVAPATAAAQAAAAIDELTREARASRPPIVERPTATSSLSVSSNWPWLSVSVFVLAGLAAIAITQRDRLSGAAARAVERREDAVALAEAKAALPRPGSLTVTAREPDAAVWLSLGRTPLRSMALPSDMIHALRFELEGYPPHDVAVGEPAWRAGGGRRATVAVRLQPGGSAPPAFPAEPSAPLAVGPRGSGPIEVVSDPPGAEVWLLVGATPTATVNGIEADRAYDIKVVKDGFRPAFAAVVADDWRLAGPGSPTRDALARGVTLEPAAPRKR